MTSIHVLPEDLAAQIAAGEVIERPSSVVKELLENAIDAGANDVRVEVRDGGKRLIRVGDNGGGIRRAEVELAFQHHATSKLRSADDLFAIQTLGFRGEALPSIAAVAQVTMLTRAADEQVGTELKSAGGRLIGTSPHAAPKGTLITVENLFYNIPARLKFLKSTGTESGHIHDLVNRYALAYPHISFTLTAEGRLAFQSAGNGSMTDALAAVYGAETARQMIEVYGPTPDPPGLENPTSIETGAGTVTIDVSGYVSLPTLTRANRSHITLFVNGRAVQDRNLQFAIIEAYHTFLQVGRYPVTIVKVHVPPERVDVNVHPTKAEVRFREPHLVFSAVQRAVRRTLLAHQVVPDIGVGGAGQGQPLPGDAWEIAGRAWPAGGETQLPLSRSHADLMAHRVTPAPLPAPVASLRPPDETPGQAASPEVGTRPGEDSSPLPMLRVLGQVARTYIVAEAPQGIFLIDQHAAHERILYERYRAARVSADQPATQPLLEALTVELSPQQAARLTECADLFREAGFDLEHFGGSTFLLRAVPSIMSEGDPRRALAVILDELADEDERGAGADRPVLQARREANLIASVCKQAAIKAGRLLTVAEMQALVEQLERSQSPRTCPHGRPTMIRLGFEQLAREFARQ